MILNLSYASGISTEFIIPPLLTGIGHVMGTSSIHALRNMDEGFVFYTALIANPSTGKTVAGALVKKAITTVEMASNITGDQSKLINCNAKTYS